MRSSSSRALSRWRMRSKACPARPTSSSPPTATGSSSWPSEMRCAARASASAGCVTERAMSDTPVSPSSPIDTNSATVGVAICVAKASTTWFGTIATTIHGWPGTG
jgi:hypothetical protein